LPEKLTSRVNSAQNNQLINIYKREINKEEKEIVVVTWKNPWVELVQINFSNDWEREMVAGDLAAEILN